MPWNSDKYNEFKVERYKPFFDLVSHLKDKPKMEVLDLGCGTGELTKYLADRLSNATILGIDNSAEMLAKAPTQANVQFKEISIEEQLKDDRSWDLIFANASLQWIDAHEELFKQIISRLKAGGQLAIQMPSQGENILNKILFKLVQEEPYSTALNYWKRASPLLSIDEYAKLLFDLGGQDLVIYQKMYPVIANSTDDLFEFISGSALVPYFERMAEPVKQQFSTAFKREYRFIFQKFQLFMRLKGSSFMRFSSMRLENKT